MALETFNPPVAPSPGTNRKPELKLLRADFGDGYSQVMPDGLNHIRKAFNLRWDVLTRDQAVAISTFLESKGGYMPFLYQYPATQTPIKVTCEDWQRTDNAAGLCSFTAVFKQSFSAVS